MVNRSRPEREFLVNTGVGAALSVIDEGYEVYSVTDASGGVSRNAYNVTIQCMIQSGAIPVTWLQVLLGE